MPVTDEKKIDEVLTRAVAGVLPSREELKKTLTEGKRIRLYQGFDPTGNILHIGHLTGLRKLRQFQELGHEVIFLVGDGTGQAGDPSGKTSTREGFLTREELQANAKEYVRQASRVLDFKGDNPVRVLYNSQWLEKLGYREMLSLLGNFSLQQLSERDLFRERIAKGETVNMREFIYPLLQAYDSVAMEVDLEIGGTDQLFNMLTGRSLVKTVLGKEKFVLTTPLLTDASGKKIGKTEGNAIGITDIPRDLYGKVMALPDEVISKAFEYITTLPGSDLKKLEEELGSRPIDFKKRLAFEVVKELNDEKNARDAESFFEQTFQKKETPKDISEVRAKMGTVLGDVLVGAGLAKSKSEFRRLVEEGAIDFEGETIRDLRFIIQASGVCKVGKHRFLKIITF